MNYPIFLGRLTIFSWGFDFKLWRTLLTVCWRPNFEAYLSIDGTPTNATFWFWGRK